MDKKVNLYHVLEGEAMLYKAYATDVRHVLKLLDEYGFELTPDTSVILIERCYERRFRMQILTLHRRMLP